MKTNNYIEHLKRKGYVQISDDYFETSDGCLFQYVEKIENGSPIKYLIMVGKNKLIDNKWCNKDCNHLSKKNMGGDCLCFCSLNNRYIGFIEDVINKEEYCVSTGESIERFLVLQSGGNP